MTASLDRHGDVFVLTLGDGENRFTRAFVDELNTYVDEVEQTPGTALVTTGSGKQYSSGLDLEWMADPANGPGVEAYLLHVEALFARLLTLPVYTVAALNGHTFAAGAMLASAHDLRLMRADRGFWCLPEAALGLPFRPGMQSLLTTRLPALAAQQAMVTGARYGGTEAAARGLVEEALDEGALLDTAIARAAAHAGLGRDILRAIKGDLYATTYALLLGS